MSGGLYRQRVERTDRALEHYMSKQNWTDLTVILENILGADWGQGFQSGQNVVKSARLWAKSYKKATKKRAKLLFYPSFGGGDSGTRTHDLCVANASLYQLSYIPMSEI